jgi:hypothetical protein
LKGRDDECRYFSRGHYLFFFNILDHFCSAIYGILSYTMHGWSLRFFQHLLETTNGVKCRRYSSTRHGSRYFFFCSSCASKILAGSREILLLALTSVTRTSMMQTVPRSHKTTDQNISSVFTSVLMKVRRRRD